LDDAGGGYFNISVVINSPYALIEEADFGKFLEFYNNY